MFDQSPELMQNLKIGILQVDLGYTGSSWTRNTNQQKYAQIDTTWHNASVKKIQLKTPFTVTITTQLLIPILRPVAGNPIGIRVNLSASASGISEVYWKE